MVQTTLTSIIDTKNNVLSSSYDDFGRKVQVVDPDRGTWQYSWDGLSRVRTQTDARGVVQAFEYDPFGRLERRFMQPIGSGSFVQEAFWAYDSFGGSTAAGALIQMQGVSDTVQGSLDDGSDYYTRSYRYDSMMRPTMSTTHVPAGDRWAARDFTEEYCYDPNYNRLNAQLYPGGEMTEPQYSAYGDLLAEMQLNADATTGTAYRRITAMSVRRQVTFQQFGNGTYESSIYDDSTGVVTSLNASGLREAGPSACGGAAAPLVRTLAYQYDQFLNLHAQSKTLYHRDETTHAISWSACTPQQENVSETYLYDDLQRLKQSSRTWDSGIVITPFTSAADTYSYDDLGNLTSKSDYADTYNYEGPGPHAVSSVSNGGTPKAQKAIPTATTTCSTHSDGCTCSTQQEAVTST